MGKLAKTKPIVAAAALVALIACAVFSFQTLSALEDASSLRDFQGNKVPAEQAEHIREADAHLPLASCLAAYDGQGERIAVSEVDPESYDGFVAVLDDSPQTAERLQRAQAAGAVDSSDGTIASFDSLETFAQYFDESDLDSIEPNYKVYLADDPMPSAAMAETEGSASAADPRRAAQLAASSSGIDQLYADALQSEVLSARSSAGAATISPNDPLAFDQADLETIQVKEAWDAGADGEGVVVGVVDSGLVGTDPENTFQYRNADYEHEDLDYANHILPGWDFTKLLNGKAGPTPDGVGHGTFITGQIAATQGNGKGITGIAPKAKVQPFKTHNEKGEGSSVNVYYALVKVLENLSDPDQPHVDVLNLSLINTNPAEYVERVYQALADAGVIIVAATGNQASSAPTYPASYDCVIGVSATKKSGVFDPSYSNYGAGSVYVAAPGTSIMGIDRVVMGSIIIGDTNRGPDVYSNSSGTSMACPEVAGLAALAKSIDKSIDQYEFMSRLRATSVDMGDPGYDQYYGWGLIDCGALIASMQVPDDVHASGSVDGIDWYITSADSPNPYQLVLSRGSSGEEVAQRSWTEYADIVKSVYANPRLAGGEWLNGAFAGMVSVEAIRLGNMSVTADVPCRNLFDGLNSLNTIELGVNWQAPVSFPDPPGVNCVTGWAAASDKQEHALGSPIPCGVSETYNAVYSHDYRPAGDSRPPTLHEPGVSVQRCAVCGHEASLYSYVDPSVAGAAHWGEFNGGVGWYVTPESYAAAPGRLMIYPLNGEEGTIKRQVAYPADSAWPWDDLRSMIRSVRVAPGVNAGNSIAYMFKELVNCTSMDLAQLDVSSVEYMNQAFYGCAALEQLDLSSWNPASCENIQYMFTNCANISDLRMPPSAFAILKTAKYAFYGCKKVTELDLSGIKFYEDTAVDGFFGGCAFKKITLKGAWNIDLAIPLYFSGAYDEHGHLFSGKWEAEDGTTYAPSQLKGVSGTLVPYVAHQWGPPSIISTGTCGTVRQYTCTLCGKIKRENVEGSASHDIAHAPEQVPSCDRAGYAEHWYCTKCNAKFADAAATKVIEEAEALPALGHDRRAIPGVAATCTQEGTSGGEYCARCETVFSTPVKMPALGHDHEVRETPPTCTQAGTVVRSCKRCDDVRIEEGAAPLGHDYEVREVPPTCTEPGSIARTCKRCGDAGTDQGADALGHDYEAKETSATCTEAGSTLYACKRCDSSYAEQGAAPLGHDFSRVVSEAVAPTCAAEGREALLGCLRCSEQRGGGALPRTDHRAGAPSREEERPPTCTSEGSYEERTRCEACGETLSSEHRTVAALGHDHEVRQETSATCTQAGTVVRACKRCDDVRIEEGAAPLGHDYEIRETSATCTEAGRTSYECRRCGDAYEEQGIAPLGHDYEAKETSATCTEAGSTLYACKRCDSSYAEQGAAPLGHDYEVREVPPTCTEPGSIARTCKRCGDARTDQGADALGHDYEAHETAPTCTEAGSIAHTCRRCGDAYEEQGADALGHDYEAKETSATCTEAGSTLYACKRCDSSYVEQGAAPLGHDFSRVVSEAVAPTCAAEGREALLGCLRCSEQRGGGALPRTDHRAGAPSREEERPPTCTSEGSYEERTRCEACGETLSSEHRTVAALGHDHEVRQETSATCTQAGTVVRACKRCDDVRIEEGAAPLGHDYEVREVPPTCTEPGSIARTCKRCGDARTDQGADALDHDYEAHETAPTCTEAGSIAYTCKRCGDSRTEQGADALGHAWIGPLWQWEDDLSGATAMFVCDRAADHKRVLKAEVTVTDSAERTDHTATVHDDGKTYTDTVTIKKVVDDGNRPQVPDDGGDQSDRKDDIGFGFGDSATAGTGAGSGIAGGGGVGNGNSGGTDGGGNTGSTGSVGSASNGDNGANAPSTTSPAPGSSDAGAPATTGSARRAANEASLVDGELRSDGFRITLRDAPGTTKTVEVVPIEEGAVYDALLKKAAEDPNGTFIGVFDIVLKIDGEERHDRFGALDIGFPVPDGFAGRSATLYHAHAGDIDRVSSHGPLLVTDGHVTLSNVEDLSPFALKIEKAASSGDLANTAQRTTATPDASSSSREAGAGRPAFEVIDPRALVAWTLALVAITALVGSLVCFGIGRRRRR